MDISLVERWNNYINWNEIDPQSFLELPNTHCMHAGCQKAISNILGTAEGIQFNSSGHIEMDVEE